MKKELVLKLRLHLAELVNHSELLPDELADQILTEYSDSKIISLTEKLAEKNGQNLQEFIGLMLIGVVAWIRHAKKKAEKHARELFETKKKTCDHLIGSEKKNCIADLRRSILEKKISTLKTYQSGCSKLRDSDDCRKMMSLEIKKIQKKIKL